MATLITGTPSLPDRTIAWSPSAPGNFLYRNHFRSSAMMNPFLPQVQYPHPAFWDAWFSGQQGSGLPAAPSGTASKVDSSKSGCHMESHLCAPGSTPYTLDDW